METCVMCDWNSSFSASWFHQSIFVSVDESSRFKSIVLSYHNLQFESTIKIYMVLELDL